VSNYLSSSNPRVFIVIYSGGSILSEVQKSNDAAVKSASLSALVRRSDQAEIFTSHGVEPILFKDLDDVETLERVASDFDVVINCANAFHAKSAEALIKGLGHRKKTTGKDVYFIHVCLPASRFSHPHIPT
jgi:hypothetical protein